MYVVLDEANAIESVPSELNAWKSYDISGLNEVFEGQAIELTVNSETANGDYIGFRVYAVNWDGTLIDPDGRAFYVLVGEEGSIWTGINTTVVPTHAANFATDKSNIVEISAQKLNTAATYDFTMDDPTAPAFNLVLAGANNAQLGAVITPATGVAIDAAWDKFDKVKKAYTMPAVAYTNYVDDKTYTGTLVIKDADGFALATLHVAFTKTLPTGVPAGFSIKTGQLDANGVYNCYLVPDNWAANAANNGTMQMDYVFNFPAGLAANYIISFAASQPFTWAGTTYQIAVDVPGSGTLSVDKAYIDNKTEHQTVVSYNYGQISSVKNATTGLYDDVTKTVTSFPTIYNCIYNSTYSWKWEWASVTEYNDLFGTSLPTTPAAAAYEAMKNRTPEIKYEDFEGSTIALSKIFGTSAWDSAYNAYLSAPYNGSLTVVRAKLTSDANGVEEYYTVTASATNLTFAKQSGATNPTTNVASTLAITCKDMYGHTVTVKVPVTVTKR